MVAVVRSRTGTEEQQDTVTALRVDVPDEILERVLN